MMKFLYFILYCFLMAAPIKSLAQTIINGGTTTITTSQTITDLTLIAGNLVVADGTTLIVNGVFEYYSAGSLNLEGTGKIAYGSNASLKYSGNTVAIATDKELPAANGPVTIVCNNTAGVRLQTDYTITGSLQLNTGIFTIGAGITLVLDGASLESTGGFIAGNSINNSSSNLVIQGQTGGVVLLPVNGNIGLHNLSINNTRTVALNGNNNLSISGSLTIAPTAIFDNGGESQITNGGTGAAVSIGGRFINRDKDNFTGTNGSIPTIAAVLAPGCTIEYGLATGTTQLVTKRNDYRNLAFSGTGIKLLAGAFSPVGTVSITDQAMVNALNYTFGDSTTNLVMNGGRLMLSGTNNPQPHMAGNYSLTGGVVEFGCTSSSGQIIRSATYKNIEVVGTNVFNSNGNITLTNDGSFTIKTGGNFTINDDGIVGPLGIQTVLVEMGGTFKCGDKDGFSGKGGIAASSVNQNIENVVLSNGSTVEYSRANDQVITNNEPYHHLNISGTAGNKTASTGIITVLGNFTKTGASKFLPGSSTFFFNSSIAEQYLSYTGSVPIQFFNLTNSNSFGNGLNLLNDVDIINSISLSANSKLNLNNADINLLSTATTTARVGEVAGSSTILYGAGGRFNVQRFFPNNNPATHRAWRLVTAPLNETGSIYKTWQLGGEPYSIANQHKGVLITGPQIPGNGLDYTPTNNYSLRKFNGIDLNVIPVENTHISLSPTIGTGYLLFVRGDRNPILTNPLNSDYTTVSSRGKLQTGTTTIAVPAAFALVGNPYASPIDFNAIIKTNNINQHRFYIWDPNVNLVGGYVVMEDSPLAPGVFTPVAPNAISLQNSFIQSSQAFFVEKTGTGPGFLTFEENSKTPNNNLGIFRPAPEPTNPYIRANLYLLNTDSSIVIADGNLVELNNGYSDSVNIDDAVKFNNINETFALLKNNVSLAIERRKAIAAPDTLFYQLTNTTQRAYQMQLNAHISTPGIAAFLEDAYSGLFTPINLLGTTNINFVVNNDSSSANKNRFKLICKNVQLSAAFDFISVDIVTTNPLQIQWRVINDFQVARYEMENSMDGIHYSKVFTKTASPSYKNLYNYQNQQLITGKLFLRIKAIDFFNQVLANRTIIICSTCNEGNISIFPNPTTDGKVNLYLINQSQGKYLVSITNANGQLIGNYVIDHTGQTSLNTLQLNKNMAAGYYEFNVISPNRVIKKFKIMVNTL